MVKLEELTIEELKEIDVHAPNAAKIIVDEEEVTVAEYLEGHVEDSHENRLQTLPVIIDAYKRQLEEVNKVMKRVTIEYAEAEGEAEDNLSEVLSATLEHQNFLKGVIKKYEEDFQITQKDEETLKEYYEILERGQSVENEIEDLQKKLQEIKEEADAVKGQLSQPSIIEKPSEKKPLNGGSKLREDKDYTTWVDKTKNKTRVMTSKALGSSASFLESMKNKLPNDES